MFEDMKCPICGNNDVEIYAVDHRDNYYRCASTGTNLEIHYGGPRFKPAPDWKRPDNWEDET